jgi:hypothetical protein
VHAIEGKNQYEIDLQARKIPARVQDVPLTEETLDTAFSFLYRFSMLEIELCKSLQKNGRSGLESYSGYDEARSTKPPANVVLHGSLLSSHKDVMMFLGPNDRRRTRLHVVVTPRVHMEQEYVDKELGITVPVAGAELSLTVQQEDYYRRMMDVHAQSASLYVPLKQREVVMGFKSGSVKLDAAICNTVGELDTRNAYFRQGDEMVGPFAFTLHVLKDYCQKMGEQLNAPAPQFSVGLPSKSSCLGSSP